MEKETTFTFLGTGSSDCIPRIGCQCAHCKEARKTARELEEGKVLWEYIRLKKRILRKRCSILIKYKGINIFLDVPPEIQSFINKYDINDIEAIFLSHKHSDHISGLQEFEIWDKAIDFYGGKDVIPIAKDFVRSDKGEIKKNFHFYELKSLQTIHLKNLKVIPFEVEHKVPTFGFLFEEDGKKFMHFSDSTAKFNDWHIEQMQKVDVVVFHTTTYDKITSDHISVKDVLDLVSPPNEIKIKKIILSHINHHNLTYEKLVKKLAEYDNIVVAYDGMEITI